jgi:hypothetical protein
MDRFIEKYDNNRVASRSPDPDNETPCLSLKSIRIDFENLT